jgi:hypothetical protein
LYAEVGQLNGNLARSYNHAQLCTGIITGDNCGASYLNDGFEKRLLKRLEDEHYLDYNGEAREDIVRYATLEFENRDKRLVDIARRPVGGVKIPSLRGDDQRRLSGLGPKNFKDGYVLLNKRVDMNGLQTPFVALISMVY